MKERRAMPRIDDWMIRHWAATRSDDPSVDLFAVATARKVVCLGLRDMVPRGLLVPVAHGFEIYLQHPEPRDILITRPESRGLLSVRQRFTLAHEIAHTFFYSHSDGLPRAMNDTPHPLVLEQFCNRGARQILMPTDRVKAALAPHEPVDLATVQNLARRFRASLAVVLDRLAEIRPDDAMERCLVLAKRAGGGAQINQVYFGIGLLTSLPRPRRFTDITDWINDIPREVFAFGSFGRWQLDRPTGYLELRKVELGNGFFLLQVNGTPADRRPPSIVAPSGAASGLVPSQ